MNCLLPAKINPIEGGMGHTKPLGVLPAILSFFNIDGRKLLIGHCPHVLCYYTLFVENEDKHTIARNTKFWTLLLEIMHCVHRLQISPIC